MGLIGRLLGLGGSTAVADLIQRDRWSIADAQTDAGPAMIRFRTPVLSGRDAPGHGRLLRILWAYGEPGQGAMPERADTEAMRAFEDRLVEAFERDAHAVLVAVLTFDGARQWVVYTGDTQECQRRLEAMPQEATRYPVELTTEEDRAWRYLHDEILRNVPWQR